MKLNRLALLVLMVCSLFSVKCFSEIRLPAILGNHMVLQQNTHTKLWGWSDPNEHISISSTWDTSTYNTRGSADAKWMVEISTPAAGGPYSITIKGSNKIVLEDVMIGEVWDCSGQSNMEMSYNWGAGIVQYRNYADSANNPKIRFFHIPRLTAPSLQDDTKGKWVVCNPDDMKRFSLVGYFFGKQLQERLGVPIGLINASWGGTPAESWTPADSVASHPILKEAATLVPYDVGWTITPGFTYNAMIYPITNFTIAGVLWYQGEGNIKSPSSYQELLTTLIRSWRYAWKKEFPFYFVQIAPYAGYGKNIAGPLLREGQSRTLAVPRTGMVVINDLVPNVNDIHPKNKKDVGQRLANLALGDTYGIKDSAYHYSMFSMMQIVKGKVTLSFSNVEHGLVSKGGPPSDFYIAGADKVFWPALAIIKGNTVIVSNKNVKTPVAVRFGFTNGSMPNLFNKEGLPVNLFRTDDWDNINTLPAQ